MRCNRPSCVCKARRLRRALAHGVCAVRRSGSEMPPRPSVRKRSDFTEAWVLPTHFNYQCSPSLNAFLIFFCLRRLQVRDTEKHWGPRQGSRLSARLRAVCSPLPAGLSPFPHSTARFSSQRASEGVVKPPMAGPHPGAAELVGLGWGPTPRPSRPVEVANRHRTRVEKGEDRRRVSCGA